MKMFKDWVHNTFFYGVSFLGAVLFVILVLAGGTAHATGNNHNDDGNEQAQGQAQGQGQTQGQQVNVDINLGSEGGTGTQAAPVTTLTAEGSTIDAGDVVTNNDTAFFAFSSRLPSAGECFGAVEGGGGSGSGGGFLGWRPLNNDCWFSALAEAEENVEVRARLKCASKMFRNAISFTEKKSERQIHCIGFMVQKFVQQIEFEKSQVQAMIDAQTLIIQDHTTKETERTTNSVTRAVERCTDCFGANEK